MRKWFIAVGLLFGLSGVAVADEYFTSMPESGVHVVRQQRGLFNIVRLNKDLPRQVCGGADPVDVRVFHTVGDGVAAVFTGILWTPAHLRVTCPMPTASR
jgi:hypothetical protein